MHDPQAFEQFFIGIGKGIVRGIGVAPLGGPSTRRQVSGGQKRRQDGNLVH